MVSRSGLGSLCHWKWTEWSSCQVLCDLNGKEPIGPRENRTREKYFLDDPYNLCKGERQEKQCDQECQSKNIVKSPVIAILTSQSPLPSGTGLQHHIAATPVAAT